MFAVFEVRVFESCLPVSSLSLWDIICLGNLLHGKQVVQLKSGDAEFEAVYSSTEISPSSADYSPDLIKRVARWLSGPLNQVETSGSSIYRIHQLRAFIAALALLHHLNVEELHAEPYNEMRVNIANRFNDIADGRRLSHATLTERTRYVEAMFLIRLAAQYFSLFKRRGPVAEALFVPVLGLVLTGASVVSALFCSHSSD